MQSPKSGRPVTTREIMIYDCLPIVGVQLVWRFLQSDQDLKSRKTYLPTGRVIVWRAALNRLKVTGIIIFPSGSSRRPVD